MTAPSFRRPLRRVLLASFLSLLATAGPAGAQALAGQVRILVGFPAGGTIDVVTRQIAEDMRGTLGVPVVVENPTGAGGQLAAQALKRATPDGLTLMVAPDHTLVILPETLKNPGFDVAADFVPIGMVADYAGAVALGAGAGVADLPAWIAKVKASGKPATVGVAAPGSKPVFALHALSQQVGATFTAVPYRGSVPLVQDLTGGHLDAGITALGDFTEYHKAGRLKVAAVTGERRTALLPEVPSTKEQGYPLLMNFWIAMHAPAGTPAPVVQRLNQALNHALATPKVKERMAALVFDPAPGAPAAVQARVAAERAYWAPLIQSSGWVRQ